MDSCRWMYGVIGGILALHCKLYGIVGHSIHLTQGHVTGCRVIWTVWIGLLGMVYCSPHTAENHSLSLFSNVMSAEPLALSVVGGSPPRDLY